MDGDQRQQALDDALAWVLVEKDEGRAVSVEDAVKRFPQYEPEVREFFESESKILQISEGVQTRTLPSRFAHYDLLEVIGRGAFGEVRRAWDTKLFRSVAIKVPRFPSADGDSQRRFVREGRAASHLSHANIAKIYEVDEFESTPYIASEYVEGTQLRNWGDRPIDAKVAAAMVADIADGLAHAHERGVIHRDLNPQNILVDVFGTPRILDFGLAKCVDEIGTVTMNAGVVGTPFYVSPEQLSGDSHDVDGRTDIYSLGGILYELVTGERPFGGDLSVLLHRIEHEAPVDPREIKTDLPAGMRDICLTCLAKSPEHRFRDAAELRDELRRFVAGEPLLFTPSHESTTTDLVEVEGEEGASQRRVAGPKWVWGIAFAIAGIVGGTMFALSRGETLPKTVAGTEETSEVSQEDSSALAADPKFIRDDASNVVGRHALIAATVAFNPDEKVYVTGDHAGAVVARDAKTHEELWSNRDHKEEVWSLAISPLGDQVATASWDHKVHLLSMEDGRQVKCLATHENRVSACEFDASGDVLVTGDTEVHLWNAKTGVRIGKLTANNAEITDLLFTPDQQRLIAVGWDGHLTEWSYPGKEKLTDLKIHEGAVWHVDSTAIGDRLVTCGEDGFVRVWDVATWKQVAIHDVGDQVTCAHFHPDGRRVVFAGHNREIRIWNLGTDEIDTCFQGHTGQIYDFAMRKDGKSIIAGDTDGRLRVWSE